MIKRKGQIIPKRIIKATNKKYQHLFKFGCDVEIVGKNVTSLDGGVALIYPNQKTVKRPSKITPVTGMQFGSGVVFIGFKCVIYASGVSKQMILGGFKVKGSQDE